MKNKIEPKILIVAVVFATIFLGVLISYSYVIIVQDYKIASLNTQIQNITREIEDLTNQTSSINNQTTNLTTAYLASGLKANIATALQEKEIITANYAATQSMPYNYLSITGTVTNTGNGTAFETGLHVVAYDVSGNSTKDINLTLPFGGSFGTDGAINDYLAKSQGGMGSLQLESLGSGQTKTVSLLIYHEGTVSNWVVTPVWKNNP